MMVKYSKGRKLLTALDEISECPECTSAHLVKDYIRAEMVCASCGLVISEQLIDEGPEWRTFDSEQKDERARTGAPMSFLLHDKGLSTDIGWQNRDFYGQRLPIKNRAQVYRMRKWQHRTRVSNSTERNITVAMNDLNKLASKMGLPKSVKEVAAVIYRKAAAKSGWARLPILLNGSGRMRIRSCLTEKGPGFSRSARPRRKMLCGSWMR